MRATERYAILFLPGSRIERGGRGESNADFLLRAVRLPPKASDIAATTSSSLEESMEQRSHSARQHGNATCGAAHEGDADRKRNQEDEKLNKNKIPISMWERKKADNGGKEQTKSRLRFRRHHHHNHSPQK